MRDIDISQIKPEEIVSTANSGITSELEKLIYQLNIFIRYILSGNNTGYGKDLFDKYPEAFIKVERAFIYFFATTLYKFIFSGNGKGRHDKSAGLQTVRNFFEKKDNLNCYKLYQYLLAGKGSQGSLAPFKNSDIAGNFFENMYTGSPYFNIEDADTYIPFIFGSNLTPADLTSSQIIKDLGGVWSKNYIKKYSRFHSPEAQFLKKFISASKGFDGDIYPFDNLKKDSRFEPFLKFVDKKENQYIFNKENRERIENLFNQKEYREQAWSETKVEYFIKEYETELNLEKCEKDYKDHKDAEKKKKENVISPEELANLLALNVSNYMTGKITAEEFQVEDKRIRASAIPSEDPSIINNNETLLNEIN